jgi:hypothetical protein
MRPLLEPFFEEQLEFRFETGASSRNVFIGGTEFLAVKVLKDDPGAYTEEFNRWLSDFIDKQMEVLDEILQLHANRQRFDDLCNRAQAGNVAPLVGSGMSVPSGKKMWSAFLEHLRTNSKLPKAKLKAMLAKGQYEEAAEALFSNMPKEYFDKAIEHDLRLEKGKRVQGAVRLLPGLFPSMVLTTNFDDVLERRYDECGTAFKRTYAGTEIGQYRRDGSGSVLLKLHGDCYKPETRVLRTAEYEAAYGIKGTLRGELSKVYESKSLLCLGCSLAEDRTMALIHNVAKRDKNMPLHFAFMQLPETEAKRVKREHFLTERKIFTIWYKGDHDECITALLVGMLRELKKL